MRTYCMLQAPASIVPYEDETLAEVLVTWEAGINVYGNATFSLSTVENCPGLPVISITTFDGVEGDPIAFYDGTNIKFNIGCEGSPCNWWAGASGVPRPPGWLSYEGILVHEMGHSLGAGHTGDEDWSYDTGVHNYPTMAPGPRDADNYDTVRAETLAQDDRGVHQWITTPMSWWDIFSTNPSWEMPYPGDWGGIGSGGARSTAHWLDGYYSLRVTSNNGVLQTAVYDPFRDGATYQLSPGMFQSVTLVARAWHREHSGESGAVLPAFQYSRLRYVSYNKMDGAQQPLDNFSAWQQRSSPCYSTTAWQYCDMASAFALSPTLGAYNVVAFRVRFTVPAGTYITYLDRTGAWAHAT